MRDIRELKYMQSLPLEQRIGFCRKGNRSYDTDEF